MLSVALAGCSPGERARSGAALPAAAASSSDRDGTVTPAVAPAVAVGPVPIATLKELMDSTVDPAADGVWDAVAVISTEKGTDHHEPRTPQEWAAVRREAITLIEAMNLVVLPGRQAAPPGTKPGLGELAPPDIERSIAQQRALFAGFAKGVQGTALQALEAIDRKDSEGLLKAGSEIDAACEACHVTFWYPNQPK